MTVGRDGRLIAIRHGYALGWAWDAAAPDESELIDIYIDDTMIGRTHADELRNNLLHRGIGSGRHGFRYLIPMEFFDGKTHRVFARYARSGTELPGSPLPFRMQPEDDSSVHPPFTGAPANGKAMALVGKDGWPFLCNTRTMDQLVGRLRLSGGALSTYREAFRARWDRFKDLGIPYVFAAAPMKEVIYSEYLPDGLRLSSDAFPLDQLLEIFRSEEEIDIADLRPVLLEAKKHEQVYYRTDTHYNMSGGYHVYRRLAEEAARTLGGLEALPMSAFRFRETSFRGDLSDKRKMTVEGHRLLDCASDAANPARFSECAMRIDPACLNARELDQNQVPSHYQVSKTRRTRVFEQSDAPELPSAVVVRDSFAEQLIPYLSEQFRRVVYVWVPNPPFSVIEDEEPDIVLQVMAERFLIRPPLMPDWELGSAKLHTQPSA